jgi:hypothetical protein
MPRATFDALASTPGTAPTAAPTRVARIGGELDVNVNGT